MDSSLYTVSRGVMSALAGPIAPPAFAAASVKEVSASPLRQNFLAGKQSFRSFTAAAPAEGGGIALYSPAFYAACTVGGIASCGLTHTMVTPLDIVKCNMQARSGTALSPAAHAPPAAPQNNRLRGGRWRAAAPHPFLPVLRAGRPALTPPRLAG